MRLRHLPLAVISATLAIAVVAACSDAGSGGGVGPDNAGADASSSSVGADGGGGPGSGDGGGSKDGATDAGSTAMDSGAVVGSCKKVNDGMYSVVQTGVSGGDVDAGATYQFLCSSNTSTDTYPTSAMDTTGCTITPSADGCTTTYDCTVDNNGYTAVTKGTQTIAADGNGFTTNFVVKWTRDTTSEIVLDCTFTKVGTRK